MKLFLLAATLLLVSPFSAAAERRVALVIGNNGYQQVSKLEKAANDAQAVGRELAKAGFEVTSLTNVGQKKMNQAINQFAEKVAGGGVGVFFFAGHGLQINNQNFLLPVDMDLPRNLNDVADQAVSLQVIQDKLAESRAKFALLVIDACRDNPLPKAAGRGIGSTRGLAQPAAPNGQIILFSAGAHQQALDKLSDQDTNPNGLFTREFLPMITTPGVSATEALRRVRSAVIQKAKSVDHDQHPALYDQTDGDFYFVPGAAPAAASSQTVAAAVDSTVIELEYWRGAQQANTVEAYQSYLSRYPKGQYAELAEANIRKLKGAPQTATQRGAGADAVELALWETVSDSGDVNEYREYLRQFPNGRFAAIARNRIQSLSAKAKAEPEADQVNAVYNAAVQGDAKALAQLKRLGEQGSAPAQLRLAVMYEFGQGGLAKDGVEALKWYRKAAAQGNARAQANLGIAYVTGRGGLAKDEIEAVKWFRKAADQGDDRGQTGLGYMYLYGRGGLPKDEAEAIRWYRKGAEQGNPAAQAHMGEAYETGRGGLVRDDAEAVRWYRKAADQGRAAAQYSLALMYAAGRGGLSRDLSEAQSWARKAAEQGHADAAAKLKEWTAAPPPRALSGKTVDELYAEREGPECKGKPLRFICQGNLKNKLCAEYNAYGQPGATICPPAAPEAASSL